MNYKELMITFYRFRRRMPTYSEMAEIFGFKSKNSVNRVVERFLNEGFLDKDNRGKILPGPTFNHVKKLGYVKAGFPSPAEEELQDTMSLDEFLIEKKESTYVLEVDGDSMIDAHIKDGDLVIAERTNQAKDGQIVIAEVDGEFTMKYFKRDGKKVWLEPANKAFKPIYPTQDLKIAAIVKGVIRKY